MPGKIFIAAVSVVLVMLAVVIGSTIALVSRQIDIKPLPLLDIDTRAVIERLAGAIQVKTISFEDHERSDPAVFLQFHDYLLQAFPLMHKELKREVIGDYSLLYTWQGMEAELEPILLVAHMDVVPVETGQAGQWLYPPFKGAVSDGYVWGRGTMDMKSAMMASFESIEHLLGEGFQPERTVYLAIGHDEETGGRQGAARIAELLEQHGVRLAFTLDEGSAITHGIVPGMDEPVALIGVAEKGYLSLELVATGEGGHSSIPPQNTAVGKLARAIHRLESNTMPVAFRSPITDMFDYLAPEMPFARRTVVANHWLFEPVLLARLEGKATTNALIRTTTAVTKIKGGIKENVLPTEANATVNFRILTGETVDEVIEHVRKTINDPDVSIQRIGDSHEPSMVSDSDSGSFTVLHRTIKEVFPDTIVAPSLVIGGTDSKHYSDIAENSYRFLPLRLEPDDLIRIHGINERISIRNYQEAILFYSRLLKNFGNNTGAGELQ